MQQACQAVCPVGLACSYRASAAQPGHRCFVCHNITHPVSDCGLLLLCVQLAGDSINFINWQVYAELESPDATAQEVGACCCKLPWGGG